MKLRKKRHVKLWLEQLEDRCVPAWLTSAAGDFSVLGTSDTARVSNGQFQLQASIVTTSDRYGVTGANGVGQWQAVTSTPNPFQQDRSPTEAEWALLSANFGTMGFAPSLVTLADNSLIIKDAEAVGPSRQAANNTNAGSGQSLFIQYNPDPAGVDPPAANIDWLQFVTTNSPLPGRQAGVQFIDNRQSLTTPFYNVAGGVADGNGFADLPWRPVQSATITWQADLFPVAPISLGNGATTWVVWQGVSWGWQTGPAAPGPQVNAVAPNAGGVGGGYAVTIAGSGFTGATNVSFGSVPATSFTVNSDTSITATVPPQGTGTVDVTVTAPTGTSSDSTGDQFTYVNVSLSNPGNQTNAAGDTVSLPLTASASNGDAVTLSATGLPAGLSVTSNGILGFSGISGTIASDAGSTTPYSVTVTATDATAGVTVTQSFFWTVNTPTVTFMNPGNQTNNAGDTVTRSLFASSSNGDAITFSETGLPAGLAITSSRISGTIASDAGSTTPYSVTITATDESAGVSVTQSLSWTVNPPTVTFLNPGNQTNNAGDPVSLPLLAWASNGDPITFSATELPPGLSISSDGVISGTIGGSGTYTITFAATDVAADVCAMQTITWTVA